MRGVTVCRRVVGKAIEFQLTRLMRGVTRASSCFRLPFIISTHTPHARRDTTTQTVRQYRAEFQLTRLMRGVTRDLIATIDYVAISTHTPHARRDIIRDHSFSTFRYFNSHASCEA